jgi:hypothetical protein
MPIPHFIKDFWTGRGPRAKAFAEWANRVATWCNLFEGTGPIRANQTGSSIKLDLDPAYGSTVVPVKITGAKSGSYYPGSVYGSGTAETATETGKNILLTGFEIDHTATQGFYFAQPKVIDIAGTDTLIYEVLPQDPIAPDSSNTWVLANVAGVKKWLAVYDCDDNQV